MLARIRRIATVALLQAACLGAVAGIAPAALAQGEAPAVATATATEAKPRIDGSAAELAELRREFRERLESIRPEDIDRDALEQAELDVDAARVNMEGIEVELRGASLAAANLEAALTALNEQIRSLRNPEPGLTAEQKSELAQRLQALVQERSEREQALTSERASQETLRQALGLAQEKLTLARDWSQRLRAQHQAHQALTRQAALEELQTRLKQREDEWIGTALELRRQLEGLEGGGTETEAERRLLSTRIQDARERAKLLQMEATQAQIRHQLAGLESEPGEPPHPAETLKASLEQADLALGDLRAQDDLLKRKQALLAQQREVAEKRQGLPVPARGQADQEYRILSALLAEMSTHHDNLLLLIEGTRERRDTLAARHEASIQQGLWARRSLPSSTEEWREFASLSAQLPAALAGTVLSAADAAVRQAVDAGLGRMALAVLAALGWMLLLYLLRAYLELALAATTARDAFSANLASGVLALVRGNVTGFVVAGALMFPALILQLPQPAFGLLLVAVLPWLLVKLGVDLSRLLLERREPTAHRERLQRRIRAALVLGGGMVAVMALLHLLPVSPLVREVIGRFFMLFLFVLVFTLLQLPRLILSRISEDLPPRQARWLRVVALFSVLWPLAMLLSSAMGLFGYVNLAWTTAQHLAWGLLVLVGWMVVRGVTRDVVNSLKNWTVQHSGYGLLWTQGLIEPLHRVARVGLALTAWLVLFRIYGWDGNSRVVQTLGTVLGTPLFGIGGKQITPAMLLVSAVVFAVVVWAARWSREVTYRWVFSGIADTGARNSLAVFSQYFVVLIGVLIALNLLGIDLTTLTVFAGALGVGLGFGLQNIANNFISGIILLAERPVRAGDTVSIGTNNGSVTRIGIRSLTVRTWDNQEVIIPNADLISQPFTNWTHSDYVIRTVLTISVSHQDDPKLAQDIMREVVLGHPGVLEDPEPVVYLDAFGPFSLDLRVHYYTDMEKSRGFAVKSEILMNIWSALKQAGITIPYPQQEVHLRAEPASGHFPGEEPTPRRDLAARLGPRPA